MVTKKNTIRGSVGLCCRVVWQPTDVKAELRACRMAKKAARKRKPNAAFMRPVQPGDALGEVVGTKPIPRTEVAKKLWAYIKRNKLQDPKNKRMIKTDDALRAIFGSKSDTEPDPGLRALARLYEKL